MGKKGFYHNFSDDELKKWMEMPPELKLQWLQEINEFMFRFTPEKSREIIRKFRKGDI